MQLRDKILGADDLKREKVEVPEWGMTLYVREMTGSERDQYEVGLIEKKDLPMSQRLENMRARLVVLCVVDDKGNRVFSDEDIEAVGGKNAQALTRLTDAAQVINKLSDEAIEKETGN